MNVHQASIKNVIKIISSAPLSALFLCLLQIMSACEAGQVMGMLRGNGDATRKEMYRSVLPLGAVVDEERGEEESKEPEVDPATQSDFTKFRVAFERARTEQAAKVLDLSNKDWRNLDDLALQPRIAQIEILNLSGNPLGALPARVFACAPKLKVILLSNCQLESLDHRVFEGAPQITDIDLSHNNLAVVPGWLLLPCEKLRSISLAHNPLATLPDNFFDEKAGLTGVSLAHTGCTEVPAELQRRLGQLSTIDLRGTGVTEFDFDSFVTAPVKVDGREIRSLPQVVLLPDLGRFCSFHKSGFYEKGLRGEKLSSGCYLFRQGEFFRSPAVAILYSIVSNDTSHVSFMVARDILQEHATSSSWKEIIHRCLFEVDGELFTYSRDKESNRGSLLNSVLAGPLLMGLIVAEAPLSMIVIGGLFVTGLSFGVDSKFDLSAQLAGAYSGKGVLQSSDGVSSAACQLLDPSIMDEKLVPSLWCLLSKIESEHGEDDLSDVVTKLITIINDQIGTRKRVPSIEGLIAGCALRFEIIDQLVAFLKHPLSAWSAVKGETADGRMLYQAILDSRNPRVLHALWHSLVSTTWLHDRAELQMGLVKSLLMPRVGIDPNGVTTDGLHLLRSLADGNADPIFVQEVLRLLFERGYAPVADEIKLISQGTGKARDVVMSELCKRVEDVASRAGAAGLHMLASWAVKAKRLDELKNIAAKRCFDGRMTDAEDRTLIFELAQLSVPTDEKEKRAHEAFVKNAACYLTTSPAVSVRCDLSHRDVDGCNAYFFGERSGSAVVADTCLGKFDGDLSTLRGIDSVKETIMDMVGKVKSNPRTNGNGILLYGPPGTGKTSVLKAAARCAGVKLFEVELTGGKDHYVNKAADRVKEEVIVAGEFVRKTGKPAMVFIDEIDSLARDPSGLDPSRSMDMSQMTNNLQRAFDRAQKNGVLIAGATNYIDTVKGAIRRRFRYERYVGLPSSRVRAEIIRDQMLAWRRVEASVMEGALIDNVVEKTAGWAPSAIVDFMKRAESDAAGHGVVVSQEHVVRSHTEEAANIALSKKAAGIDIMPPTLQSRFSGGGFEALPGYDESVMSCVQFYKLFLTQPELFAHRARQPRCRLLLYGPGGTGKTSIARALSEETSCAFYKLDAGKFRVDPSRAITLIEKYFADASVYSKAIIFIDEIDAILGADSPTRETLQTLLEGFEKSDSIIVIGATNRPWNIYGPALSRFVVRLVGLPDVSQMGLILRCYLNPRECSSDVMSEEFITSFTHRYIGLSPRNIAKIVDIAGQEVMMRDPISGKILPADLEAAAERVMRIQRAENFMYQKEMESLPPEIAAAFA